MSKVVLPFLFVVSVVLAQQDSDSGAKVLTVCEVLGGLNQYADTAVAVVGRMERSVSLIDHYEFLSQDRCDHPFITHGHVWPSKIQIWAHWEEGMPKPPGDRPTLQRRLVDTKLSIVRKTTKLGSHQEPRFDANGRPHDGDAPNEWAIVYGRIVRNPDLNKDCGAGGCGGDDVPSIIIAEPSQVRTVTADGSLMPENK